MSKKLQEKQARRLAEEKRRAEMHRAQRKRNLVTIAIAVVVAVAVGFLIVNERNGTSPGPTSSAGPFGARSASEAGCSPITDPKELGRDHIPSDQHPTYSSTPPTSGPHYATPADTGFYSAALPQEQLVHNLEHGHIVIWYSPDSPQDVISEIESAVAEVPDATVASPFDQVPSGFNFTMTAWGHMESCKEVSKAALDDFRTKFQGRGPEPLSPTFPG